MSCVYCMKERRIERASYNNSPKNHDGSLEYVTGKDVYNLLMALLQKPENRSSSEDGQKGGGNIFLVPYQNPDGSTDWVDRYAHKTIAITGVRNGAPYYYGLSDFMATLGGRGLYSELAKMYEDGDYFHTRKSR